MKRSLSFLSTYLLEPMEARPCLYICGLFLKLDGDVADDDIAVAAKASVALLMRLLMMLLLFLLMMLMLLM